jgi:hypothetical protein
VRKVGFVLVSLLSIVQIAGQVLANQQIITFNDDGGWCWFEDERAIIQNGNLIIGTVADGRHELARRGNIEVVTYDLKTGAIHRSVLHEGFQRDDHDSPAFVLRGDSRILAMYSKHHGENKIFYRISEKLDDSTSWRPEQIFMPSSSSRITYTNLFRLASENNSKGRIYSFYRGYNDSFKPSWMTSDDDGETWISRGLWIGLPFKHRHRPYVKYTSNNKDEIHFVFTEGHPHDFYNSIYHTYFKNGAFYRTDGTEIKKVSAGPIVPNDATKVFQGDANNVAWISDLHLDEQGRPVIVYSVNKNASGQNPVHLKGCEDHRYRYARWDGRKWHDHEIAYAGTCLYPGQDDYTGNICIDPDNLNVVYLSSDVNIQNGQPNVSGHYEIYKGVTKDYGKTWTWTAITTESNVDNIRPIVPKWNSDNTALLWLRGKYYSYTNWDLDVVGIISKSME